MGCAYLGRAGGRKNGANQTDLGGAVLHLSGGVYAVSQPVSIPAGYANYRIEAGTIIAHPTFGTGAGQFLLQLGGVCGSATAGLSKNCATDISVWRRPPTHVIIFKNFESLLRRCRS